MTCRSFLGGSTQAWVTYVGGADLGTGVEVGEEVVEAARAAPFRGVHARARNMVLLMRAPFSHPPFVLSLSDGVWSEMDDGGTAGVLKR